MRLAKLLCLAALVLPVSAAFAQSGKIAGTVIDAATGEALPGVAVAIDGTTQGAITDVDGYYNILNVRPGTYSVRASFIGYTAQVLSDVRVNIDLTTEVNFTLQEETVGLDEVVVQAERPVVQRDVSSSVANISAEEIENLPVADIDKVVGLQAGFERGLTVRGAGGSQVQFMVDGFSTQGGRDNVPFTGVSYTAVDEVQVQTGGFDAEFGNVRAGLISVVTKEGTRDRYFFDGIIRYSPPSQKYMDGMPNDANAFAVRPYFDPEVAMVGTNTGWANNKYLRESYPTFEGWNSIQTKYNAGKDPSEHVTAAQLMEAYRWYQRKDFKIHDPDYQVDATLGGPVPLVSKMLGDLRFTASYRSSSETFAVPLIRKAYDENTFQGKLTSDIAPGMKLNISGMWARQKGINPGEVGTPNMWNAQMPYYPWDGNQGQYFGGEGMFATHYRNPMNVTRWMIGADFTHTLSSNTFYQVQLQRSYTDYFTFATEERDYTTLVCIEAVGENEARTVPAVNGQCSAPNAIALNEEPFGWEWRDSYDVMGTNFRTGGHWFSARDTSNVGRWLGNFSLTSQLNRWNQIKVGVEYIISDYNTNYGEVDPAHPHHANPIFKWSRQPQQGAIFARDKMEFLGMVANLGLRLDYFHSGGNWYIYDTFDQALSAQSGRANLDNVLETGPIKRQIALSPRLGVSFPITENSKLYFNYGHFREMPDPLNIFNIEEINTGAVNFIGNPELPMEKTVMYELGFEQNLFNQFLLRVAGFYRDLSEQGRGVRFSNIEGTVNYTKIYPYNYSDVRGAEFTLTKNRGKWIRGFANYTYLIWKGGNFGLANYYENPVQQRTYLLSSTDYYQSTPIPEPFARFNLEFIVPENIGNTELMSALLGDWRINLLGEWRMGRIGTWAGGTGIEWGGRSSERRLQGNVQERDFYTFDMRFSKNFQTRFGSAQLFADVTNVFNIRHMYGGWNGDRDYENYLKSLHLPRNTFEGNENGKPSTYVLIPGKDKPGDFRHPDVEFQPIEAVTTLPDGPPSAETAMAWRWAEDTETYYRWQNNAWQEVPSNEVKRVLKDKAYINMPNDTYRTFLNPRNVFFGVRLSF